MCAASPASSTRPARYCAAVIRNISYLCNFLPCGGRQGHARVITAARGASALAKQVPRPDQDSRSAGHRAAASVRVMDITIHASFLAHDDPEASLAFYRDVLDFEVRNDVGSGKMRWITVGPAGQPGTSILLAPPAADPGTTEDERRTIAGMMAKGTYGWILLAARDLDGAFERLPASG